MKVLFTTNVPSPYRVDFFNELGKLCELTVLFETKSAKSRSEAWEPEIYENFRAVFMKGIRVGEAEAFCPEILNYLSSREYDVIVIGFYSSPTGMLAIEYMRIRKISFWLSSDGGMEKEDSRLAYKIKKHLIRAASGWLSTGAVTSSYLEHYGADAERICVYPFTSVRKKDILSHPLTELEKGKIREKLHMPEQKIILSVGQFIYRKGYDLLLDACEGLPEEIGVYLVGGEPTEEYLKLQREKKLTHVHFVGFQKKQELADYYQAADLFVLPTREDIWGLVINEAMSYGLPIVTTKRCVAGMEMVQEGKNGYLVEAEDSGMLHHKMLMALELHGEESLRRAREHTIENMAWAHMRYFIEGLEGAKHTNGSI